MNAKVGDVVVVKYGDRRLTGTVIEDRGKVGMGGRQMYRIIVDLGAGGGELHDFEIPADDIREIAKTLAPVKPLAEDIESVLSSKWLDSDADPHGVFKLRSVLQRALEHVQNPLQMLAPVKVGECLRRLRELRGVYMGEMAKALAVSVSRVSDWELDRVPMSDEEQRLYLGYLFDAPELYPPNAPSRDARVQELLEKNTALVTELRRVDRQRQVREFHAVVVGSELPDYPAVPPEPILRRQMRLITEEYLELMEAVYGPGHDAARALLMTIVDQAPLHVDFYELIDAAMDLEYVDLGLCLWCGVDSQGVWDVVQAANMAKAGGPKRASDGKQQKPPGWKPPDIGAEIERQKAAAIARQRGPK